MASKRKTYKRTGPTAKELLAKVEVGAVQFMSTDKWHEWLDSATKFHDYSFYNCMMILSQSPTATRVAGYQTWKRLGRQVNKGETGIRILAPVKFTKQVERKTGETETVSGLAFRTVCVFDIAQTDGDDLPGLVEDMKGESQQEMLTMLIRVATDLGLNVVAKFTGAKGGWITRNGEIALSDTTSPNQQAKTLLHEIGHKLLGHFEREALDSHIREIEAESLAYIVASRMGFDTESYSFGYVANWGQNKEGVQQLMRESGPAIIQAEKVLVDLIEQATI